MYPPDIRNIAILGNHTPRQCGIATFTADLAKSLIGATPGGRVEVFAMNDRPGHAYSHPVRTSIDANRQEAYFETAALMNERKYDVLCVQHEFGIFGGEDGCYLLDLLRNVKMPVVTTLHTILQNPSPHQRKTFEELLQLSERAIVMSQKGAEILGEVYGLPSRRIEVIPHGIHDVDHALGAQLRQQFGIGSKPLVLTFGLLSKDKGVHEMVTAMSSVINRHPNAMYVVVGATHPHIKEREGEHYREYLERLARELGVEKNILFVNRFVTNSELAGWLAAADIYVTPYLKAEQITSGTLAYAVGGGNAVVSTPYWHAEELLSEGRGVLVPFSDASALGNAISGLLSNPQQRSEIAQRAYEHGKSMRWSSVGEAYLETFSTVIVEGADHLRQIAALPESTRPPLELPALSLTHMIALSDDTGILQHATFRFPNRAEGYCTDDNARAFELAVLANAAKPSGLTQRLADIYFSFLCHAFDPALGKFRNFMSYEGAWLDVGSDDCQGRAFRALAVGVASGDEDTRHICDDLLRKSIPMTYTTTSPRAWAAFIVGAAQYLRQMPHPEVTAMLRTMADRLHALYLKTNVGRWRWFENALTYDNARLSEGLIVAGLALNDRAMIEDGITSLSWLMRQQTTPNGVFAPIGSSGFYAKDTVRAWYDQQPLESAATIDACITAARATGDRRWLREADQAFRWFLGENSERLALAQPALGRCFDGLQQGSINRNCGAESTIAYLMALIRLSEARSMNLTGSDTLVRSDAPSV